MKSEIKSFRDLIVWQKSADLAVLVYKNTDKFPNSELYGIVNQMRRAVVSVSSNIAEGFKKRGRTDKVRFMNIGQGSLEECRYYLILAKDLGYGDTNKYTNQLVEVSKLLQSYSQSILNSVS